MDVAIERLTHLHPGNQVFIFGPEGQPFWARFKPDAFELELLRLATSVLEERSGTGAAPLTVQGGSGAFSAFILDAEETLFAVVLLKSRARGPAEDRAANVVSQSWR